MKMIKECQTCSTWVRT